MSRHRNVRAMNYDDYDDYDDVYGRSVDEDYCISPTDASQFLYNRNQQQGNLGTFLVKEEPVPEDSGKSESFVMPEDIDEESKVKLLSCLDEIRNIVGDSTTDQSIVDAVMRSNYDMATALDSILKAKSNAAPSTTTNKDSTPKATHNFTELKDFAKFHLKTNSPSASDESKKMFKIPKFNFGKPSTSTGDEKPNAFGALSIGKPATVTNPVPELKSLNIGGGKPKIDLMAALSASASRSPALRTSSHTASVILLEKRALVDHSLTSKHLKRGSQFGRILSTNYKYQHSFTPPPPPKRLVNQLQKKFDFSTPSPDDIKIQFFKS